MSFIYLASPYTHEVAEVRKQRQLDAELAASLFMSRGSVIYSPVAHGCAIDKHLPKEASDNHDFWMKQCYGMLDVADALHVLLLDGVSKSKGVRLEIIYALKCNLEIVFWFKGFDGKDYVFERQVNRVGFKAMGFQEFTAWQPIKDWIP